MEIDKVVVVVVKISFLFFRKREARVARTLVQLYGSLYYFWEWLPVGPLDTLEYRYAFKSGHVFASQRV